MQRCLLMAIVAPLSLAAPTFALDEPAAARKPLKYWVERLGHADQTIRERAVEFVSAEVAEYSVWEGEFLFDPDRLNRRASFRQEAKVLIPDLVKFLKAPNEDVVAVAGQMLMVLGPEAEAAVSDLQRLMLNESSTAFTRTMTFCALLFVMPDDEPVGPIMLKLLNSLPQESLDCLFVEDDGVDGDNNDRENAEKLSAIAVALSVPAFVGRMISSGHTKVEVPYLVKIAKGDYPATVRALAVGILESLEFDAKSSVPALRALLKDEDRFVRKWAVNALLAIEQDPKLIPELVASLELNGRKLDEAEQGLRDWFKEREMERRSWREAFADGDGLTLFVQTMKYGSGFQRRQAIQFLGRIGPSAKSVVPELRKALEDTDAETRRMAAQALRQIETTAGTTSQK